MGNWKKVENERGFLCYINKQTNIQQWDHPKFCDVKQAIDDCNYVVYATYRLALKIRVLQRSLNFEEVPLDIIRRTFDLHGLANNENSLILELYDLELILLDIFFDTNKKNHSNIDVDFATEILINFLYNIFDSYREGKIQVLSAKMVLGLLSTCSLQDLHKYLFFLCADHNNCITRVRLQGLLQKLHMLMSYLHEDFAFEAKWLNLAVEKCFRDSPGLIGITEGGFISWLNSDVPFLSWLPLVLKLRTAETVIHSMKCSSCKSRPLLGLRYRCTKCPKYVQCQRCFLTGRISHSHKLSHSLREYSLATSSKNNDKPYLDKLCALFCLRDVQKSYSIVRPCRQFANENIKPYNSIDPLSNNIEPLSSPDIQLQGVIRQLEAQNRELQQILIFGNQSDKEMRKYLEEYRLFMAGNIQKLKMLKNQIICSSTSEIKQSEAVKNFESTPIFCNGSNVRTYKTELDRNSSPITVMTDLECSLYDNNACQTPNFPPTEQFEPELDIPRSPVKVLHNNLDEALAKLQQILANNFLLEDSLSNLDNTNLKFAVTEVEGMLTSIIDNVESSRCNSALPGKTKS